MKANDRDKIIESINDSERVTQSLRDAVLPAPLNADPVKTIEEWNYELGGLPLKLKVSPCSWMYAGYGFQAEYRSADSLSWGFVNDKALPLAMATPDDVIRLLNTLTVEPCRTCSARHILNPSSNRKDQCEVCFMKELNDSFAKEEAKDARALARRDAKHKTKGYSYRVTAWVHPSEGGDDYMIDIYMVRKPRAEAIRAILKRKRSRVLNDYSIVTL
jgi:hypothetical protein